MHFLGVNRFYLPYSTLVNGWLLSECYFFMSPDGMKIIMVATANKSCEGNLVKLQDLFRRTGVKITVNLYLGRSLLIPK